MTQIGEPQKEWELPAPVDVPSKEQPVEKPTEVEVETPELVPA